MLTPSSSTSKSEEAPGIVTVTLPEPASLAVTPVPTKSKMVKSPSDLEVEDEGVSIGTFSSINFVGAGITATDGGGGTVDVTVPAAATVDLQEAYDNGNSITIPASGDRVVINTPSDAGGIIIEHSATSYVPGLHVNSQNSGAQGVFVQVKNGPISEVVLGDGRTTSGATGGSSAGYFARFASSTNTDQAVVYINNASASDDQPSLRVDQSGTGDAAEFNGTVLVDESITVTGISKLQNEVSVTGHTYPTANALYDLGTPSTGWRNIYLTGTISYDSPGAIDVDGGFFINTSTNNDIIIQNNNSEWARFDSSGDTLNFTNAATIDSDDDLTISVSTSDNLNLNCGFLNIDVVNSIDIERLGVNIGRIRASTTEFGFDADTGIDIILDHLANQDILFKQNGTVYAAFDTSVSGEPLVLAGLDNTANSGIASPGNKLYIRDFQGGSNPLTEIVNRSTLAGASTGNILRLTFEGRNNPQSAQTFLAFNDSGGEIGDISGDGAGGVTYSPFTGAHKSHFDLETQENALLPGMILSSNGKLSGKAFSPEVEIAKLDGDSRVAGVFVGAEDSNGMSGFLEERRVAIYNAVGDGYILVTNKNGDIQNGDLIESSSVPGYGQKQSDDIFRSKTVAKCTQDIDWNSITETVSGYKYTTVSCTYHCG
jgi:hypothetical protein